MLFIMNYRDFIPSDDYTELCADWLRENPQFFYIAGGVIGLLIIIVLARSMMSKPKPSKKESKKTK